METKPLTLTQLITAFLASRQGLNRSRHTLDYYRIVLTNFEWYARTNGWPEPALITKGHLREFLNYVATETYRWPGASRSAYKPASPATVHHYGRVIKCLFNWAEEEEYLEPNPAARLRLGSPQYKGVEPYSDDEVRAMLRVCQEDARFRYRFLGARNLAIISLLVATGLRLEELSGMRLSHLDPRLRQVQVVGKGGKLRLVPITGEARKALRHYLGLRPPGGDELWKTDDGQPLHRYSIQIMIQRLKRRAGVNGGGGPHRFRHYFATRYLEAGGDLNSLRLLLGHATLDMVLRYSKYTAVTRALSEHDQFSPLDRLYRNGWR